MPTASGRPGTSGPRRPARSATRRSETSPWLTSQARIAVSRRPRISMPICRPARRARGPHSIAGGTGHGGLRAVWPGGFHERIVEASARSLSTRRRAPGRQSAIQVLGYTRTPRPSRPWPASRRTPTFRPHGHHRPADGITGAVGRRGHAHAPHRPDDPADGVRGHLALQRGRLGGVAGAPPPTPAGSPCEVRRHASDRAAGRGAPRSGPSRDERGRLVSAAPTSSATIPGSSRR